MMDVEAYWFGLVAGFGGREAMEAASRAADREELAEVYRRVPLKEQRREGHRAEFRAAWESRAWELKCEREWEWVDG